MATTDATAGGRRVFISYRREDSEGWVGRLADELRKHFPQKQIFQDIHSIDPGADFKTVLNEALATAGAMLVVIGPRWLSATDKQGRKRLENPADLVRQEVAESLRRPEVRVFPLLVNGAEMPAEEDLPEPLKPLAQRHAFDLTAHHWANDVARLVEFLKKVPGLADQEKPKVEVARRPPEQENKREEHTGSKPGTLPIDQRPTGRERIAWGLGGALVGTVAGLLLASFLRGGLVLVLFLAVGAAIVGAASGGRSRVIISAIVCAAVASIGFLIIGAGSALAAAYGVLVGGGLGAIVSATFKKPNTRTKPANLSGVP